ncbi:MAG: bifunctional nicotinamidase/pyrazinamidase [Pseudomonadota bacterium]
MVNHAPRAQDGVLLVIDVQNDFCPGGHLAVPDGADVVPVINRLAGHFDTVVLTQDWHPADHASFASSHPGNAPFDTITLDYGPQILWPDHCVQGTSGAEFHRDLDVPHAQLIVRKGFRRNIDSYSAFFENDHTTPTGLTGYLRDHGIKRVVLVGLALDFCVRYSAEDAHACGFEPIVVADACRAIDTNGSAAETQKRFAELSIPLISSDTLVSPS